MEKKLFISLPRLFFTQASDTFIMVIFVMPMPNHSPEIDIFIILNRTCKADLRSAEEVWRNHALQNRRSGNDHVASSIMLLIGCGVIFSFSYCVHYLMKEL